MFNQILLDKNSFKALSAETRVNILKELNKRRKTLTELSVSIGLGASTIKEHLQILEEAELIVQVDEGRKWKYYELTKKGKTVLEPQETRIIITLGIGTIAILALALILIQNPIFNQNMNIDNTIVGMGIETSNEDIDYVVMTNNSDGSEFDVQTIDAIKSPTADTRLTNAGAEIESGAINDSTEGIGQNTLITIGVLLGIVIGYVVNSAKTKLIQINKKN